ncbi:MAG: NAD-dependent deacylase [Anaerolineae bacterium]|nr:NAD-dependent deacylase [Chloroflexota bacterium]MBN8639294.1 NAD-dependent deacylase [Anaerolineae bacterium]
MTIEEQIRQAAALIKASERLVVLTGAGVSKESGVPTFRDALDGLWAKYDPMRLATPQAFASNPKLVWEFYEYRRRLMSPAQPNPAHQALAELERRIPTLQIITQNVDDLHEQAGSTRIIRLHGKISANKCSKSCQGDPTPVDVTTLTWDEQHEVPRCPHCGAYVRPDVVWFGEMLPLDQLDEAKLASARADVMLVVGTSGTVMPAADMPHITRRVGGKVIEINPSESELTPIADLWLSGAAGNILPRVLAALDEA